MITKFFCQKERRVFSWFWSKSIYLKQVMSTLQNIILCQKDLWKFKSIPALILQSVNVRMALKFKEKSVNCHFTRILFMNDLYLWKYVLRIFFSHLAQVAQPAYSGIIFRAIYISNILQSFETNYTISVCIKALQISINLQISKLHGKFKIVNVKNIKAWMQFFMWERFQWNTQWHI